MVKKEHKTASWKLSVLLAYITFKNKRWHPLERFLKDTSWHHFKGGTCFDRWIMKALGNKKIFQGRGEDISEERNDR